MKISTIFLLLISVIGFYHKTVAQEIGRDSLLSLLSSELDEKTKFKKSISFVNSHATEIPEIESNFRLVKNKLVKNDPQHLQLLYAKQHRICFLRLENECKTSYEETLAFAKKIGSVKYVVFSSLNRVRCLWQQGKTEESEQLLESLATIVQDSNDPLIEVKYYIEKSIFYRSEGKVKKALSLYHEALGSAKKAKDTISFTDIYIGLGRIFKQIGEIDSAAHYYNAALDLEKMRKIEGALPVIYNNLGNIYHVKGKYDEAIAYYMESIALKEKINDVRGLAIGYHNIGAIKLDIRDYDGAREMLDKSNKMLAKNGQSKLTTLNALNALKTANTFFAESNYAKALEHNNLALSISEKVKFKKGITSAQIAIGENQIHLSNYKEAIKNLRKGLDLAQETGYKAEESAALVAISDWYIRVDEKDISEGYEISIANVEKMLLRAQELSEGMDYGEQKLKVYKGLQKLYQYTGNARNEALNARKLLNLKDSLFNKDRSNSIAEWETKYTTAEKEKEIIGLEAQNKISNFKTKVWQWLAVGASLLFIVISILGYNFIKQRNLRLRLEEASNFRTKVSSDLHDDVGSILTSVAMQSEILGLEAQGDKKQKFDKLSSLTREAMTRMRDTVWAIDARKDNVQSLVYRMLDFLSATLENHRLEYKIDFDEEQFATQIDPNVRQAIYLIFKEGVTNAVKHSNGDKINIKIRIKPDDFLLSIKDNGEVYTEGLDKISGLGLENMKMRANKVSAKFEINTDKGFCINIYSY